MNSLVTGLLASACLVLGVDAKEAIPVRLGVAPAGSYLQEQAHIDPLTHPPFFAALQDLGASVVCYFLRPVTDGGDRNSEETRKQVEAIDSAMRAHGLQYMLDVELSNFAPRLEVRARAEIT